MPVTAWSPMVCEQVVCPAPLLPSANDWTPVHGAMKVTYDGLTLSWPSVYRCLLSFPLVLFLCGFFCLYKCVIGCPKIRNIIGDYEYVHMWTLFFSIPLSLHVSLSNCSLFSQENNLMELWRTIRTKVGRVWKSDRVTSSAGAVTK